MTTVISTQYAPVFGSWLSGSVYNPATDVLVNCYSDTMPLFGGVPAAEQWRDKLDAAIRNNAAPYRLVGHSDGAQVLELWLRTSATTCGIDPADLEVVLTASPQNKYGGVYLNPAHEYYGLYRNFDGYGFPDDTPYRVRSFARQYDYYADHPVDLTNELAVLNIDAQKGIHTAYYQVSLDDPNNIVHIEGSNQQITYLWSPTFPLPLLTKINRSYPLSLLTSWIPALAAAKDTELRPPVEAAHTGRPHPIGGRNEAPKITKGK